MRILFTGASSFTGYWFIRELTRAGHHVSATYTGADISHYEGIRKDRVRRIGEVSDQIFNCSFGSARFVDLLDSENKWDLLCHHAAEVTDYKSSEFDYNSAVKKNTSNLVNVLKKLREKECDTILLTGSVFENDEGRGSEDLRAFSLYGLSKSITYNVFRYYAQLFSFKLGKFVIPNPFGPFEEARFTTFLMKTWFRGETAIVKTPEYVRDNIHVSLLAKVYNHFAGDIKNSDHELLKINPSGYCESQGEFARRFATQMKIRFDLNCKLELANQKEFAEPKTRINLQDASKLISDWDEQNAWDELGEYYKNYLMRD